MRANVEPAWAPDADNLLEMLAYARVWAMAMAERHDLSHATLEFPVAAFSAGAVALLEQTPCRGAYNFRLSACWFVACTPGTCKYELCKDEDAPCTALELRIFTCPRTAVAAVFLKGTDRLLNSDEIRGLRFWKHNIRSCESAYVGVSTPGAAGRHCLDTMTRVL